MSEIEKDALTEEEFLDRYDELCDEQRSKNEKLLEEFEERLLADGLKQNTVNNHISNVDFYINTYLLYYNIIEPSDGMPMVGGFLGDFFIRKALWSTPQSIKSTAASLKKFYKFMVDSGRADKTVYEEMCRQFKKEMPDWQETCRRFNAPDSLGAEDIWGI